MLLPSGAGFVAFSPDGRRLATEGPEGTLAVWDARTGDQVAGVRGRHACACFSPDGKRVARSREGRPREGLGRDLAPEARVLRGHAHPLTALAFSPDGRRMAAGTGNLSDETRIWDVASREVAKRVPARGIEGGGMAFGPDGRQLATLTWDRKPARGRAAGVQLWDADGREVPLRRRPISPGASSAPTGARSPSGAIR